MDKWSERKKGKLVKKSLRLFDGDSETLDEYFPRAGHSIIIRVLVHNFAKKLLETSNRKELSSELRELTIDGSGQE